MAKSTAAPTADEIWNLWHVLQGRDGNRQAQYLSTITSLGLDISNPAYTFYRQITDREKMWWESDDQDRDEFVKIDRLAQIIEDQRTYLGTMRSVKCPIPPPELFGGESFPDPFPQPAPDPNAPQEPDPNKLAANYADMIEKMTLDLWREWGMVRQYALLGFYAVVLGSGIGCLEWSKERGIPIFRIRSPQGFYGVQKSDDDVRLQQALFVTYQPGASLALQYPDKCGQFALINQVYVADYFDENWRIRTAQGIINGTESEVDPNLPKAVLEVTRNPLGHVPCYVFPNIIMPGLFGTTMLPRALPMQDELDRLFTQEAQMITDAVNAPVVIASDTPDLIPPGWTWGKNAVAQISANGKLGKATLDVLDHGMFQGRIQMIMGMLDNTMDMSGISRGDFQGSTLTAKGVNSLLSPGAGRMDIKLQVMNEVMNRVMEDALLMWCQKANIAKKSLAKAAWGVTRKHRWSFMADPKNINPKWVKVEVFVDSSSRVDQQASEVTRIQKVRGTPQLMSAETAMEQDENIPDVGEEQRRIKAEAEELAATQVALAQQTQQPQYAPTITSAEENYAGERGGALPGSPPGPAGPPSPGAAPPSGPPTPGPAGSAPPTPAANPNDAILAGLQQVFASIPNLKGEVWLCGASAKGDMIHGLEIYLTDVGDKATILNFFKNDGELKKIHDKKGIHWIDVKPANAVEVDGNAQQQGGPNGQ